MPFLCLLLICTDTPIFAAEADVTKLLTAAGAKPDKESIKTMISKLKG